METKNPLTAPVLAAFGLASDTPYKPLLSGHINDTYLVQAPGRKLTLQRINHFVFPSPENIMENILGVTSFLREKIAAQGGDPDRETLTVVPTVEGASFARDEAGNYWRCTVYVDGAASHESVQDLSMLEEAGRAFGRFQQLLCDYPADTLHEIIPDFHNTPARYRQLEQAAEKNAAGRLGEVGPELDFARARKQDCALLMDLLAQGELPLRVTHNDTKLSNVLLDDATGKAVCVIDLDTVMPGLCAFDFGDSIRAGASTAAEDEDDLSKVHFDLDLFRAYSKGFLSAAGQALTEKELETLPDGARLMTLEVGMRFLADYLNGDVYFRTAYPTHNLDRARNQFALVREMEEKRGDMDRILRECLA